MLRRYERELKQLRSQLDERSKSVVDQRRLLELDEQRRRAEEDKMAAIRVRATVCVRIDCVPYYAGGCFLTVCFRLSK